MNSVELNFFIWHCICRSFRKLQDACVGEFYARWTSKAANIRMAVQILSPLLQLLRWLQ